MKNFLIQRNKGFTLVETMVALSVFTLSILSLFAVLASGVKDTNYAKNKITATYLAEEGIEYVRNMRDTYVLYSGVAPAITGWTDFQDKFIDNGCATILGCYFDNSKDQNEITYDMFDQANQPRQITKILVSGCTGVVPANYTSCPELLYDTNGVYGYFAGSPSGFRRQISVEAINSYELKVVSTVYWRKGSAVYNVSFADNLFDLE